MCSSDLLATYLPILDKRVKLAMIGGAFGSYRSSIYAIPHCICNCLPGIMEYGEMSDVVALHAPRPVLIIHGIHDKTIYPRLRCINFIPTQAGEIDPLTLR